MMRTFGFTYKIMLISTIFSSIVGRFEYLNSKTACYTFGFYVLMCSLESKPLPGINGILPTQGGHADSTKSRKNGEHKRETGRD